ncbi:MAG: hypothetical protein DWQ34_14175 [Planctomycetota bacterium]|nr:MAG: hypothetical protein DWQ29_15530 [Planctomycetota bacterium]REJ91703.1 MAG: hypothetical protein DWQ34_14175 [Planctomycetota bacterium]REK22835.1 MAG: hypothetical protein DWQ41_18750 [Planctomycetota bacterium]REK32413.1 MAG: hypothetical protein DWQ45_17345 [Planctomycetota bacterium]
MFKRHFTKPLTLLFLAAFCAIVHFGYSGPTSDRRFAVGAAVGVSVVVAALIVITPVQRCPACGGDLGRFEGLGPFKRMRLPMPRYRPCRACGRLLDRHNSNRPVDSMS